MVSNIPIEYEYFSNRSIQPIDRTLTGSGSSDQSRTGSNCYKRVTPKLESRMVCFVSVFQLQYNLNHFYISFQNMIEYNYQ